MSIGKISKKQLSRNLKIKNAPLQKLPIATFPFRNGTKENMKKQKTMKKKHVSLHQSTIQHFAEEVIQIKRKITKKSVIKKPIKIRSFVRFHFRMNTLQYILLLIFIYFVSCIVILMIQEGTELLRNIVIYSIIGFFTFFMGCIGWILANDVLEIVSTKRNIQNEAEI